MCARAGGQELRRSHPAATGGTHQKPSTVWLRERNWRNDFPHGVCAITPFLSAADGNGGGSLLYLPAARSAALCSRSARASPGARGAAADEPLLPADGALLPSVA